MKTIINFEELATKGQAALTSLIALFTSAGAQIAQTTVDGRTLRKSGISYRVAELTFADNQTVSLGIKQTGDVFEVKMNGKLLPIKNQDNQEKAIAEIIDRLDNERVKFQKQLARAKVPLPPGIKTTVPKKEELLTQRKTDLQTSIDMVRQSSEAKQATIDQLQTDIVAAEQQAIDLEAKKKA